MSAQPKTCHLTLIRHAKSSWKYAKLNDIDRPLNKRGRRDAPLMANRMAQRGFRPTQILCSPALRTLRTIEVIIHAARLDYKRLTIEPRLYMADAEEMAVLIRALNPGLGWVALVGHNPGLTTLANALSGQAIANVPTCGVVSMKFSARGWSDIESRHLVDFLFDYPKNSVGNADIDQV